MSYIQSAESAFFHKFGSHPIESLENEMLAARIVKRPGYVLGVLVLLIAAWCTIAFPDSASAAQQTVSSQKTAVTDEYVKIRMRKTQNYNPRKKQPAIVIFKNNNAFPVEVRWVDSNQVVRRPFTVQPYSAFEKKFRTEYLTISFWRTDTNVHMYVAYKTLVAG